MFSVPETDKTILFYVVVMELELGRKVHMFMTPSSDTWIVVKFVCVSTRHTDRGTNVSHTVGTPNLYTLWFVSFSEGVNDG